MSSNYGAEEQMPYQKVVTEILQSAKTLIADKTRVTATFKSSKIEIDNNFNLVAFLDTPETCLNSLMGNLQYLPVIKASAQRILRKRGIRQVVAPVEDARMSVLRTARDVL